MKYSFITPAFFMLPAAMILALSASPHKTALTATAQTANSEKTRFSSGSEAKNILPQNIKEHSGFDASRPKIISRRDWKANNPVGTAKEHSISRITIHHTATNQKAEIPIEKKMQNLQNFSQTENRLATGKAKPVWFDIPYHFYVAVDGRIAEGRELKFVGDSNTAYDPTGHALIVLEGNFEIEQPSSKQHKSLEKLTAWIAAQWKVPSSEIKAHNDFAATACPGGNLKKLLPALRLEVDKLNR